MLIHYTILHTVFISNSALCPDDAPVNGMVTNSQQASPLQVGNVATYTCDTGYELSGSTTRMCTASGWMGTDLPTCNR